MAKPKNNSPTEIETETEIDTTEAGPLAADRLAELARLRAAVRGAEEALTAFLDSIPAGTVIPLDGVLYKIVALRETEHQTLRLAVSKSTIAALKAAGLV